ncbi:MAG: protein kinase, partial [Clostridia bacterium]|nr:protein kinase [Clostridia bacterium]
MDSFEARIRRYEPFFGEWFLGGEIGKGSFGRVFTIYRNQDGRQSVAVLKVISIPQSEEELDALRRSCNGREDVVRAQLRKSYAYSVHEIETMNKLNGTSNVVYFEQSAIYERTDTFGWDILIRMEKLVRLDAWLREDPRRRDLKTIFRIWNDLYEGLKVCQSFGLVHMDIKPENIFYSPAIDYFKLGDFGEAQLVDNNGLAAVGKTVGSYAYMTPEVKDRKGADFSADVYSLALVMYQLLNDDQLPFSHKAGPLTDQDYARINERRWSGEAIPR